MIFIAAMITVTAVFIGLSICLLSMCLKKRAQRKDVQTKMYLKQANVASSMGISVHDMLYRLPDRPRTIHI